MAAYLMLSRKHTGANASGKTFNSNPSNHMTLLEELCAAEEPTQNSVGGGTGTASEIPE